MMAKRNTEGYVLAYLLIVITVMGVIAATLMTSTLQVVQAQEHSLVYMKDKYEAMGEVERLMANLCAITKEYSSTCSSTSSLETAKSNAISKTRDEFFTSIKTALNPHISPEEVRRHENIITYEILLQSKTRSLLVDAKVRVDVTATCHPWSVTTGPTDENPDAQETTTFHCTYSYSITDIYFSDYTLSSSDSTPEGGGT